jgi:hypothetical protein
MSFLSAGLLDPEETAWFDPDDNYWTFFLSYSFSALSFYNYFEFPAVPVAPYSYPSYPFTF